METKEIRSIGAQFEFTSELPNDDYEMSYVGRCKDVSDKDHDDRAIYRNDDYRTIVAASQIAKAKNLKANDPWPESLSFTIDRGIMKF